MRNYVHRSTSALRPVCACGADMRETRLGVVRALMCGTCARLRVEVAVDPVCESTRLSPRTLTMF